jgi:ketosteroid isomerase-like protein
MNQDNVGTHQQILTLGQRWADAEQRGDVDTLDALATDDFKLVGPLGFILNKQQWLDRYRTGDLVTRSLVWDEVEVRDSGTAAVAIGCHTQQAAYRGNPNDGRFRATHVAVRIDGRWQLTGMHLPDRAPTRRTHAVPAPPLTRRQRQLRSPRPALQGTQVAKRSPFQGF